MCGHFLIAGDETNRPSGIVDSGANPTTLSDNASVVNFNKDTACIFNQKYFLLFLKNALIYYVVAGNFKRRRIGS
jgi:hypothetical protein